MVPVNTRLVLVFAAAMYATGASFAWAQTAVPSQSGQGGGVSAASANFSMKAAAADPGDGQSRSANYIFDHGTLWGGDATSTDGPGIGGDPTGGGSGGGSGSGWDEWWGMDNPELGISPLTPAPSPVVAKIVSEVRGSGTAPMGAVPQEKFPGVVVNVLKKPSGAPVVVVAVDGNKAIREVAIVLTRRTVPWPLWIAAILALMGLAAIVAFFLRGRIDRRLSWAGGLLVLIGIVMMIVLRIMYGMEYAADDFGAIADTRVVAPDQAAGAVREIMRSLPLGAYRVTVTGSAGAPQAVMTIYVKRTLPI
jgi:hypothetical protein